MKRVLVVSPPWSQFSLPSIQVAALKAYLRHQGIDCDGGHWFLDVAYALGFDNYESIASPYLEDGEALYAALLFPEVRRRVLAREDLARHFKTLSGRAGLLGLSDAFLDWFEGIHDAILARYDWSQYALVGFSLNFGQTLASLYLARAIKQRNPRCKIILGGAEASGQLGASLLEHFDWIDFTCIGEGEIPFADLAGRLIGGQSTHDISGLCQRPVDRGALLNRQLSSMDELPAPDFDEYFESFAGFDNLSPHDLSVSIPIEASRGCPYKCSFCSLNLQWSGVRERGPSQVLALMKKHSDDHHLLDFFFVDNLMPQNASELFTALASQPRDYQFFFEIRANTARETLEVGRRAGLARVQIGIEALSTGMLRGFKKKASALHNLQGMKDCQELGIATSSNLIVGHPSATQEQIDESVRVIDLALGYQPPAGLSEFALQVGAPDYHDCVQGRVRVDGNYPTLQALYPASLANSLDLPRKAFSTTAPPADWRPLHDAYGDWVNRYSANTRRLGPGIRHLGYFDGESHLRIDDYRYGEKRVYLLDARERRVYLDACRIRHFGAFPPALGSVGAQWLNDTLDSLVAAKLMYREEDRYLSLAMAHGSRALRATGDGPSIPATKAAPRALRVL